MNYETTIDRKTGFDGPDDGTVNDAATQERRSKRRIVIIGVIAVLLAALVAAVVLFNRGDAAAPPEAESAARVTVIAPGRTTVEGLITATGTLAARRPTPVGVVGEGGRVVSVGADEGEWVRAGQVLVSIDRSVQNQTAEAARASIEVARADLDLAQSNLDRALQLVDRGFISQADVDRLTATRDAARARLNVSRAQYNELQARNARLSIYAPVSGLVLSREVEPGQTVSAGSPPLFTIAKGGEMEMLARVGETELAELSTGVRAEVIPSGTDRQFTGQVWKISPTISEQDREGIARIALSYAEGLRPGGFATARIRSGTVSAPLLPESAVLSEGGQSYVYIVDADNKVVRRDVVTGNVTEQGIVIEQGLTGSEKIVLRAGGFLNPGETVVPVRAGN